jgi:chromosome segregation ATPase
MNWRKILTISAVIAVGILIYTLYLYLGPYRGLSQQNKQLRKEIEARMASESKMREELGVAKAELAKKTRLVEDLQAEIGELKETISQTKGERELFQELKQLKGVNQQLEKEAGQLRKTIAALEADKKAFDEEASGFKKELQESRNRCCPRRWPPRKRTWRKRSKLIRCKLNNSEKKSTKRRNDLVASRRK